jgi:hypothetical protein
LSNESDPDRHLTPAELAARYNGRLSVRTLGNWRVTGDGPRFRKIGGKVFYRLGDVIEWENRRSYKSTSQYSRSA